jgi:DNA-binding MarR family transcriptional regulator
MKSDSTYPDYVRELAGQFMRLRKVGFPPGDQNHIKHREMHFLFTLSKLMQDGRGGVKASEMSKSLHITRGAISQMINEMEANGLIERISDPNDRRVVLITHTDQGKKRMDDAFAFMQKNMSDLAEFLGEEDSRHLLRILNRIIPYMTERNRSFANQSHHMEPNSHE